MQAYKAIIWVCLFILFYSYFGYALLVWCYLQLKGKKESLREENTDFEPSVSLIVAAYNEEQVIKKKIENCLEIDYPRNKLKLVFVADGSTDNTAAIIKQFPGVDMLYKKERQGKVAAINRAMSTAGTEFVVFCDANTALNRNCIRAIVKHYQDERVGAVAGEKKVIAPVEGIIPVKDGEGAYWKYESKLKKIDSDFYSVVGAAGELFSIRTKLYEPLPADILLDDFVISMNICRMGYRVVYEPGAFAIETPSLTIKDELKRKIRISAGGFQSILLLMDLLNIFKYGRLSFLYISHRVLRWVLCPVLLPVLFACSFIVARRFGFDVNTVYHLLFYSQVAFYSMAIAGWLFSKWGVRNNIFFIFYYFVFMNMALYIGFFRFIGNKQTVLWDKARRS